MPPSSAKSRRLSRHSPSANPFSSSISSSSSCLPCHHSPSITLDLIVLVLVLFSCAFLITTSLSDIFKSLSLILPSLLHPLLSSFLDSPLPYVAGLFVFLFTTLAIALEISCVGSGRRKCRNPKCKGLKEAVEFDVKVQTEEGIKAPPDAVWKEIEELPWKGGAQGDNPDYECVRKELRRMAPPNGRAVLLFRARCGCPVTKLEGWGPKRGRRHKRVFPL